MLTAPTIRERKPLVDLSIYPDDLSPLIKRLYANRGVSDLAHLELGLGALPRPEQLSGMAAAVDVLAAVVEQQKRLLIIGDFDADGATSTALVMRAMAQMGLQQVDYLVPNRFEYGYGLSPEIVAAAAEKRPDVLITVDNGIASIAGAEAALAAGYDLVITDHHLPGETLPVASAIVNPNLPGDEFPTKNLAGVGVVFYVMLALRAELKKRGWFDVRPLPNLAELLDLVALGTVADVVPLDHCNRVLVEQGLRRIRAGRCVAGIRALLEVGKRDSTQAVASDLGFTVGPRLNAAGRLDDMSQGIECLLTDNEAAAREMAGELQALNTERRELEASMQADATAIVEKLMVDKQLLGDAVNVPAALCLYQEDWHPGVVGLVAGRTKDRLHRPVIAFAPDGEDSLKGSARSIAGLHIRDALAAIDARHPKLITKFGGHAMAAGLSLPAENLKPLQQALAEYVEAELAEEHRHSVLHTDGALVGADITLQNAEQLRTAGPWGQAFPEPMFSGRFEVLTVRLLRDNHVKFVLGEAGNPQLIDAIYFRFPGEPPVVGNKVEVAFRLDVNQFQGRRFPQLLLVSLDIV